MNIRAITGFTDKETGASILAGEIIEREDDRAKALIKAGVCEALGAVPKNKPSKAKKSADK